MKCLDVGGRKIGPGQPCFIIAEAGVNHNGDVEKALELVDIATNAGADAVKFQTFSADKLATIDAPKAAYQEQLKGSQFEILSRLELSLESFRKIKKYCDEKQILFMSTPFDEGSVDFLNDLHVEGFKIASGEATNHGLLSYIGAKRKPVFLSTGMCDLEEVKNAIGVLKSAGNEQLVLLHCTSSYPTDPRDVNLQAMQTMRKAFDLPVGFSDHTLGIEVAIAAVALGACVLEKHFTIDATMLGPDHGMSLEPHELHNLVRSVRSVEQALGSAVKRPTKGEMRNRLIGRRSIVAACSIARGTVITREMLAVKRPGHGVSPAHIAEVIGRVAIVEISKDQLITLEMIR